MHHVSSNGASIPALGFGTWQLEPPDAERMVRAALEIGYRHIDTAQIYANEAAVGSAIAKSGVPRDDIFLTTKVWVDQFAPGDFERSVDASLTKLGVDEVDLLLLHWPKSARPLAETIGLLNDAKRAGKTRHIGVSNYSSAVLSEARDHGDADLVTNQVEYHPFLDQAAVLDAVRACGMSLTAYSPLAQGNVFENNTLRSLAREYDKDPGQVALRWLLQQDSVIAIPRTSSEAHAKSNFEVFDFELSTDAMARINALGSRDGRLIDPESLAPEWD